MTPPPLPLPATQRGEHRVTVHSVDAAAVVAQLIAIPATGRWLFRVTVAVLTGRLASFNDGASDVRKTWVVSTNNGVASIVAASDGAASVVGLDGAHWSITPTLTDDSAGHLAIGVAGTVNAGAATVAIANGGTGYSVNDVLTLAGVDSSVTVKATAVNGSGVITTAILLTAGHNVAADHSAAAASGGGGTGATFNLTVTRNLTYRHVVGAVWIQARVAT